MELEEAMIVELDAISRISGKVFPLAAPRTDINNNPITAPYVTYKATYGMRVNSLDGYLNSRSVEVELNLVAPSYQTMKSITRSIMDIIIGFQSRIIGGNGPFVQEVIYEEPEELFEALPKLHRCEMRFTIHI